MQMKRDADGWRNRSIRYMYIYACITVAALSLYGCLCVYLVHKNKGACVYVRRAWIIVNSHSMLHTMAVYVFISVKRLPLVFSKELPSQSNKKELHYKILNTLDYIYAAGTMELVTLTWCMGSGCCNEFPWIPPIREIRELVGGTARLLSFCESRSGGLLQFSLARYIVRKQQESYSIFLASSPPIRSISIYRSP